MNLQTILVLNKAGYTFSEDNSDDVKFDQHVIRFIISNELDIIKELGNDELGELIDNSNDECIRLISEQVGKSKVIDIFLEWHGNTASEIYCILENEFSIHESDVRQLSMEDLEMYLKYKDKFNKNEFDIFKKVEDFPSWAVAKLEDGDELDKDDFSNFMCNYYELIDLELASRSSFQWSFRNFLKSDFYVDKDDEIKGLYEHIDDESFKDILINYQDVDETFFMTEEDAEVFKLKELDETWERTISSDRIDSDTSDWYCAKHNIKNVSVSNGQMGLEDMTFGTLYIDGKRIPTSVNEDGEPNDISFNRVWISGRNFGDHKISTSFFLKHVEPLGKTNV